MTKILNRVGMLCSTAGQGTITVTVPISNKFLTPPEAGAVDGEQYFFVLEEGNDFEIFKGTVGSSGTTITRDEVIASKISGTAGTAKLTLAGGATLRSALPREGVAQGWTLIETIVASSGNNKVFDNIPDAYHDLYVVGENLDVTSGSLDIQFEASTNNGSSYGDPSGDVGQVTTSGTGACYFMILGCQLPQAFYLTTYSLSQVNSLDLSGGRLDAIKVMLDPETVGGATFTGSGTLKLYGR